MQITKAKLVVKGVPMRSKEELKVLGSTIFEGFHEQNFMMAVENLSDDPETDLNQVWDNLKLMYFKPNARRAQMKVMRKWWHKPKEMSLQEYGNRFRHVGIQLLKELPGTGAFAEDEFSDIFYFSLPMWQQNMCILNNYDYETRNFTENLSFYVASESSSELLFKAKGLSNRKEGNQPQSTKY